MDFGPELMESKLVASENKIILNGQFYLTEGGRRAVCTFCGAYFKYHHSTSSLTYHLKHKHALVSPSSKFDNEGPPSQIKVESTSSILNTFLSKKLHQEKYDAIANNVCVWISKDLRPLSIVEDKGFIDLLRVATENRDYLLPSRQSLKQRCTKLYEAKKIQVQSNLKEVDEITFAVDHWTSSYKESYVGIDACFIDSNWNLQFATLGVNYSPEAHTSLDIANYFISLLESWDIKGSRVNYIVADNNATELVKAVNEVLLAKIHSPCMGHMLQLSIENAVEAAGIKEALGKTRRIVKHLKQSPVDKNSSSQDKPAWICALVEDVATRWSSTLKMVTQLVKHQQAVVEAESLDPSLSDLEWVMLEGFLSLLKPCETVSNMLGGDHYVSCSIVLPMIYYLKKEMTTSQEDPLHVQTFKKSFLETLHNRLKGFEQKHHLYMATALDMRFKSLKCLPKDSRDNVWKKLHAELLSLESLPQSNGEPDVKRKKNFLDFGDEEEDQSESSGKELEYLIYLKTPEDPDCEPLNYWKAQSGTYPNLSRLAKKYLGIPATSVPVERLFSLAGEAISKKKRALLPEDANMLISLSNWLKE